MAKMKGATRVFFPGTLVAYLCGEHGSDAGSVSLQAVKPTEALALNAPVKITSSVTRIALHLVDLDGWDRGLLGEVRINSQGGGTPQ